MKNTNKKYKWTKDKCQEKALKYKTRTHFATNSPSAYTIALKNNWLDDVCSHMIQVSKPKGYWTYERCISEAKKYSSKSEFRKSNTSVYMKAHKNGWLDDIMSNLDNNKRFVYAVEIPQLRKVYIGITLKPNKRIESIVKRISPLLRENNLTISDVFGRNIMKSKNIQIYGGFKIEESEEMEKMYANRYKSLNWVLLNRK